MKECPFCDMQVPDDAPTRAGKDGKCLHCARRLDEPIVSTKSPSVEYEPTDADRARLAEIRRLQSIAYGAPSRSDSLARTKGFLALFIIVCLLAYAYFWSRAHEEAAQTRRTPTEVTYQAFNAVFGPGSPLTDEEKLEEFRRWRGARVRWLGNIAYVNRGQGEDLYLTVRHSIRIPASDVVVRFDEANRDQLEDVTPGRQITYSGSLHEFDRGTGLITLREGSLIRVW